MHPKKLVDEARLLYATGPTAADVARRMGLPWSTFFSNKSLDILALCWSSLDRLGIAYRRPRWDQVSVVRRAAVAALDVRVGPKTWPLP